ncbi:hypothetical protein WX45_01796 [Clostridium ljungdahlii DSM 13528]|uniref:Uncharacterized protein n=1 Tax=Clostridium ljungdahlii (strain ATCC 55383 / DSM 13528 / PETC) TaxID=748727 RepID=D8GQ83_CLOLD|nr:hypothetical protein [Clostridium ljungdahlii]ADK16174.1 conserved hypothetical protein [Clostridium ljungdahlii DSM 13528]OAA89957.1 hypothetical protein WX45_01796 [Clostridium ljungdahlii DSM 13528]
MAGIDFKYAVSGDILENYIKGTYKTRTVWERVFLHLKSKGIDAYSPGQHKGKCTTPYVVLKNTGTAGFEGSNQIGSQTLDVITYCPRSNYSDIEPYTVQVQSFLGELKGYIRPTGNITPVILDDSVNGYTQTIEYQTFQRLRR